MIHYKIGDYDQRPWGDWRVIDVGQSYVVKSIQVLPNKKLSLQSHQYRDESWTIVKGAGSVTLDNEIKQVQLGDQLLITREQKHRIENTSSIILHFIEVQIGDHLDETDIVRYEDDFGRV